MHIYRSKTLLNEKADFTQFTKIFGAAVMEKSCEPFLLVRDDDARLLVVASEGSVMLFAVYEANYRVVSYASSYTDAVRSFRGLSGNCTAKDENFVEPVFAMKAIHAFFDCKRISEHVDFRVGSPDIEILSFPTAIAAPKRVEREHINVQVDVPPELRVDMQEVCDYLDEVANDTERSIDFDDAIQIGALCGGRMDRKRNIYLFSYFLSNGDVWDIRVPRAILDGIADGGVHKLTVTASVPKSTNRATSKTDGDGEQRHPADGAPRRR